MKIELKVVSSKAESNAMTDVVAASADMTAAICRMKVGKKEVTDVIRTVQDAMANGAVGDFQEVYGYEKAETPTGVVHKFDIDVPEDVVTGGLKLVSEFYENVRDTMIPAIVALAGAGKLMFTGFSEKCAAFAKAHAPETQYGMVTLCDRDVGYVAVEVVQRRKSYTGKWVGLAPTHMPAGRCGNFKNNEERVMERLKEVITSPDKNADITWFEPGASHDEVWNTARKAASEIWESWAEIEISRIRDTSGRLVGAEKCVRYLDGSAEPIDRYYPTGRPEGCSREVVSTTRDKHSESINSLWGNTKRDVNVACGVKD